MMIALLSYMGCAEPETCTSTFTSVKCPHETTTLRAGGLARDVLWQLPDGEPPPDGWPAALLFQGSGFPAGTFWSSVRGSPLVRQVELTSALLDAGFAVLTPKALGEGLTCWNTNLPPWAGDWDPSPDAALMDAIFDGLSDGTFGPVDGDTLFAGGISSGGYMTSRLAITWPDRFDAVAVVAASYATCVGPVCSIPDDAPLEGHPPTLFVHGALDPIVPIGTMRRYRDRLDLAGAITATDERATGVHAWPADSPRAIADWFDAARP
jgi:poly(3-hydroxyoctanoate) depolymerase